MKSCSVNRYCKREKAELWLSLAEKIANDTRGRKNLRISGNVSDASATPSPQAFASVVRNQKIFLYALVRLCKRTTVGPHCSVFGLSFCYPIHFWTSAMANSEYSDEKEHQPDVVGGDWDAEEERRLVRKIDLRCMVSPFADALRASD